jgi:hypothetical protein
MKKTNKTSDKDETFLDQMDALLGTPESAEDLATELKQCGIDPEELRRTAFERLRKYATQQYSSRGEELPARMSEALSQLRPSTPLEEKTSREERASSRVRDMLAQIMNAGSTFSMPASFAPAYRNKKDETPESDKQLLEEQQKKLDGEGEQ